MSEVDTNKTLEHVEQLAKDVISSGNGLLDYYQKSGKDHKGLAGKRASDAKVRLKLEILKDGVVIGGKEVEAEREVEATSVVYGEGR